VLQATTSIAEPVQTVLSRIQHGLHAIALTPSHVNQVTILALIIHVLHVQSVTQLGALVLIILMHFPASLVLSFSMEFASFAPLSTPTG
jgi:hypothetical protein